MCSRCASAINRQPILNGERDLFRVLFLGNRPDNGLQVHCRLQQDGVDTRRKKDLPGPDEDRRRTSRAISLDPDSASRQRLERVLCICFNIISTSVSIIIRKYIIKKMKDIDMQTGMTECRFISRACVTCLFKRAQTAVQCRKKRKERTTGKASEYEIGGGGNEVEAAE